MKTLCYSIAAALIIAPTFALAKDDHHQKNNLQYTGPVETISVTELLKDTSMFAEQDVVIDGHIIRQINKDTFVFTDGEAEIQVELDDDINLTTPLTAESKVRLFGEYEGGNTPEIEVDHISVL